MSLDGYIAGANGEIDWITIDPDIDFGALMSNFDTLLMGRITFEEALAQKGGFSMPGMKSIVVSTTLHQSDYPDVKIIGEQFEEAVCRLREEAGKDIWLFGGGSLCRSMLNAELVDSVEVAVIPILLGEGKPLVLPTAKQTKLRLTGTRVYEKTGIVSLNYSVDKSE